MNELMPDNVLVPSGTLEDIELLASTSELAPIIIELMPDNVLVPSGRLEDIELLASTSELIVSVENMMLLE